MTSKISKGGEISMGIKDAGEVFVDEFEVLTDEFEHNGQRYVFLQSWDFILLNITKSKYKTIDLYSVFGTKEDIPNRIKHGHEYELLLGMEIDKLPGDFLKCIIIDLCTLI
jgi:hypothetical protein